METRSKSKLRQTVATCRRLFPSSDDQPKKRIVYDVDSGEIFQEEEDEGRSSQSKAYPTAEVARTKSEPNRMNGNPAHEKSDSDCINKGVERSNRRGIYFSAVNTSSPTKKQRVATNRKSKTISGKTSLPAPPMVVPKPDADKAVCSRTIHIPSRPSCITDIKGMLSLRQKQAVVDIGFGGLLHIQAQDIPGIMNKWMLSHFNSKARAVVSDRGKVLYYITEEDVEDVFGLPNHSGEKVCEVQSAGYHEARARFQGTYGLSSSVNSQTNLLDLQRVMLALSDGGDDFKMLFVIYVISGFLAPLPSGYVDYRTLSVVLDVGKIAQLDWCGYVLDKTCAAHDKLHTERHESNQPTFAGCMMLLIITYLHKVIWRGVPEPTITPLVQNHSYQRMENRLRDEFDAGTVGYLMVDNKTYPIAKRQAKNGLQNSKPERLIQFKLPGDTMDDAELISFLPNEFHRSLAALVRDLKVVVGDRFNSIFTLKDAVDEQVDPRPLANTITQLVDEIEDVMRHLEVSRDWLEDEAEAIGSRFFYSTDDNGTKSVLQLAGSDSSEHSMEAENSFLPEVYSLQKSTDEETVEVTLGTQIPTAPMTLPGDRTSNISANSLLHSHKEVAGGVCGAHIRANTSTSAVEDSKQQQVADDDGVKGESSEDTSMNSPPPEVELAAGEEIHPKHPIHPPVMVASRFRSVNREGNALLLQKYTFLQTECRGGKEATLEGMETKPMAEGAGEDMTTHHPFGNRFVLYYQSFLNPEPWSDWPQPEAPRYYTELVMKLDKEIQKLPVHLLQITDFCATTIDTQTTRYASLFTDGEVELHRAHFQTFEIKSKISTEIVRAWVRILNASSPSEYPNGHVCLDLIEWPEQGLESAGIYLGIIAGWEASLSQWERSIRDAAMVHVPVTMSDHCFLLVVNFRANQLEYFDTRIHRNMDKFFGAARELRTILSCAFSKWGHEQGPGVAKFKLTIPAGQWASNGKKRNSGVLAMHAMKYYSGDVISLNTTKTGQPPSMEEIRASVCTDIVLNRNNLNRGIVLGLVPAHITAKTSMPVGASATEYE